jgi:hypothetical protein
MNAIESPRSRRDFIKHSTCLAALAATAPLANVASMKAAESPRARKTNGIQIGAVSFADEGTEQVLDILQERGAVDTIYLTTFTYGRGLAGRQVPGQLFPDHGVQESDEQLFHGGLKAGADGLILSRKYSEMQLANLAAAGRAVRDAARG